MAQRAPMTSVAGASASSKPPSSRVRVAVRLRPYMTKHDEKTEGPCVRGTGSNSLEIVNWRNATETLQYQFDAFHGEQTSQKEVFLSSVKPILPHILNGQNASVFAYGPTGAGKTHTMLGSPEEPGVIPRAVQELFHLVRQKQKKDDGWDYAVDMSYLEIYNEKVLDLLAPATATQQDLPIREDKDRNILVPGLTHTPLSSFADFDATFVPASLKRTTASTKLNHRSSRSHAILLIQVVRTQRALQRRRQTGKLYLVDLAGSEDNRRTGNQGIRLKESGAINLSLFTLSKVVDALAAGGVGRVPYRDSKLTRLLQDSLGGSAHSVMIANIAPEFQYYFDTFTALNFAAKSKTIVNRPFIRETVAEPVVPVKRTREEFEAGGTGAAEPNKKKVKNTKKTNDDSSQSTQPRSALEKSLWDRVNALEKIVSESSQAESIRKEIKELKAEQRAWMQSQRSPGLTEQTNLLSKHPSTSNKPLANTIIKKQQAVVQPLQGPTLKPAPTNCPAPVKKTSVCAPVKKTSVCQKKEPLSDIIKDKENVAGEWDVDAMVDGQVMERCRQKILTILNSGSLKELKGLQKIGEKKAQIILGWRELHGQFNTVEDLTKIDGFGAKTFSSFVNANILCQIGK